MIFTKCSHAIATHISPEAAWVFGVIEYWSTANARKRKTEACKNGLYCCYLSMKAWQKELPFIKRSKLKETLTVLRDLKLIAVFDGDAHSNRANYYTIDQKEWLKFQAWSSGHVLSVEDGIALTPDDKRVPEVEEISLEDGVGEQPIDKSMWSPGNPYVVAGQPIEWSPGNHMPHTLDIKRSYKEETEIYIPEAAVQPSGRDPKVETKVKGKKEGTGGALVFEAYALAYEKRYGCQPIRNAAVNSAAKKIYEQVGQEAMALVQHYVGMNKRWYLEKAHSLQTCLGDLQAVRTAFVTGKTMTSTRAAEMDKEQSFREVIYGIERNGAEEFELFEGIGGQTDDHLASLEVLRQRAQLTAGEGTTDSTASLCEKVPVAKPLRDS